MEVAFAGALATGDDLPLALAEYIFRLSKGPDHSMQLFKATQPRHVPLGSYTVTMTRA